MAEVQVASAADIEKCLPALKELRPGRTERELRELLPLLFAEGYQLIYVGDEKLAYALLGFRASTTLFSGRMLYVDDLVTLPDFRKKGYAAALFQWIKRYAKEHHFEHLALDSGFQRQDAYRFYMNQGMVMDCIRFRQRVD